MITFNDIKRNVDMHELAVFESALAHEKKNIGVKAFCKKYEEDIEALEEYLPFVQYCFLIAYLEYFDHDFHYDESVRLEGYILDMENMQSIQWGFEDEVDLKDCWDSSIYVFRNRGFIRNKVDEVI